MKDNFSTQASNYAAFRPEYPAELYAHIFEKVKNHGTAWDVGTGNGQVARQLARQFQKVHATDISPQQIERAAPATNLRYAVESAENCSLPNHSADLVAVGQAIHWFDFDKFFAEVRRVLNPDGGVFVAFGYDLLRFDDAAVNRLLDDFYTGETHPFWDAERRHIDHRYRDIDFPFENVDHLPDFRMDFEWSQAHLAGFLGSWSAVAHFKRLEGFDPVAPFIEKISDVWAADELKKVSFPVFGRICSKPYF